MPSAIAGPTTSYLESRVQPRLDWFDKRAVWSKRAHIAVESSAAILSIVLVLLIDITTVPRLLLSLVAAAIAILIAVGKIGRFGEKWQLYRLASEALGAEVQLCLHRAGPYAADPTGADRLLVERAEDLLSREASVWRQVTHPERGQLPKLDLK